MEFKGIWEHNSTYIFLLFLMSAIFVLKGRHDEKKRTESKIKNVWKTALKEEYSSRNMKVDDKGDWSEVVIGPGLPMSTRL